MASIIDELIIKLSLDPSQFKKGSKEANDALKKLKEEQAKHAKDIEAQNKSLAQTFEKVRDEALSFFAVLLGARGVKEFISQINDANASLGRFATNMGESPQLVSEWGMAVERMGGSAEEAQSSINAMAKALYDLHTGGGNIPNEIRRLSALSNMPIDSEHGLPKFMNDIAAAAQKLSKTDMTQTHFLLQGAGISDATANTMIKYGGGMSDYLKSLEKNAPSAAAIKAAQDLQASFAGTQQAVNSLGSDISANLDPELTHVTDNLHKWIDDNKELIKSDVAEWTRKFSAGLKEINKEATQVVDFLNQIVALESNLKPPKIIDLPKAIEEGHDKWQRGPDGEIETRHGSGWLDKFFSGSWIGSPISSAHAGELPPEMDEGAFESRRAKAFSDMGDSGLTIQGQQISRGNPMPVDVVRVGGSGTDSFLGGPIGSGTALSPFGSGRGGRGGEAWAGSRRGTSPGGIHIPVQDGDIRLPAQGGAGRGQAGFGLYATDIGLAHNRAMTPEARAFLDTIGTGETPHGSYSNEDHDPGGLGGRYQFLKSSWVAEARKAGVDPKDFSPDNQDKVAFNYASEVVRQKTGQNLTDLLRSGPAGVQAAIKALSPGVWNGIGNVDRDKIHHSGAVALFMKKLKDEQAASGSAHGLPSHPHTLTPHSLPDHPHTLTPSGGARLSSLASTHPVTTSSTSNAIHIGKIDVDARGGDAKDISNNLHAALERSTSTLLAQSGQV